MVARGCAKPARTAGARSCAGAAAISSAESFLLLLLHVDGREDGAEDLSGGSEEFIFVTWTWTRLSHVWSSFTCSG